MISETTTALPEPGDEALRVSAALVERIRACIAAAGGVIGFDDYMDLALYAPPLGYYVNGAAVFGEAGDFVTAPEISPLFGACIARQCLEIMATAGGTILEFGGGTGRLAASVLGELAMLDGLPERYLMLELSPDLRRRQRQYLEETIPTLVGRVAWIEAPPRAAVDGVILANEVLDAIPVKLFRVDGTVIRERRVCWEHEAFQWRDVRAGTALEARIADLLEVGGAPAAGPRVGEISLRAGPWVAALSAMLGRGVALLVDYGYPRYEYYHPGRTDGTLQCHYRHRAHNDPFLYPGLQDITAAVEFTAIAEAAHAAGLEVGGYADQARFLLACGLPEIFARECASSPAAAARRAREVRVLTLPSEMGERCKVMALAKSHDHALAGFGRRDQRHRLAGRPR